MAATVTKTTTNKTAVTEAKQEALRLALTTRDGRLQVFGLEKLVRSMRTRARELDELKKTQAADEKKLLERVAKRRLAEEVKGNFCKTCEVAAGPDEKPVQVVFQDRFSAFEAKHESLLKRVFRTTYDKMFHRVVEVKAKQDFTLDELRTAVGEKAYEKLQTMMDMKELLKVKGEFMETRYRLRSELDDETNALIDVMQQEKQSKPQVRQLT